MSDSEWTSIFDGQSLDGWSTTGNPEGWTVEDKCIVCTVQGGKYLYTQDQYENFVLSVDFKIAEKTNSGIFFRWSDLDDPVHTGIEIQIFDSYGQEVADSHTCGAIYDMVAPSSNPSKPAGEWNNILIRSVPNHISVEKNGVQIAEMDVEQWEEAGKNTDGSKNKFKYAWKDMPQKGHIGLQDHGGKVWFRNLKIQQL
ncbi:hypothetical protein CMK18_08590 [Candidatus Poribacteria bacterium]|nr:hypothetical protein [Candidatus Poribacteria bacterium]